MRSYVVELFMKNKSALGSATKGYTQLMFCLYRASEDAEDADPSDTLEVHHLISFC